MTTDIDYSRMRSAVCWGVVTGLIWFWLILIVVSIVVGFAVGFIDKNFQFHMAPINRGALVQTSP